MSDSGSEPVLITYVGSVEESSRDRAVLATLGAALPSACTRLSGQIDVLGWLQPLGALTEGVFVAIYADRKRPDRSVLRTAIEDSGLNVDLNAHAAPRRGAAVGDWSVEVTDWLLACLAEVGRRRKLSAPLLRPPVKSPASDV